MLILACMIVILNVGTPFSAHNVQHLILDTSHRSELVVATGTDGLIRWQGTLGMKADTF